MVLVLGEKYHIITPSAILLELMLIHVKIQPDSRKEEIEEKTETSLIVSVKAPAENNEANRAMIGLLARHFKCDPGRIRIITGHHTRSKIIEILSFSEK